MTKYEVTPYRIKRTIAVIKSKGWQTQAQIASLFDAHPAWESIEGVGPILAPTMRYLMALPPQEFEALVRG